MDEASRGGVKKSWMLLSETRTNHKYLLTGDLTFLTEKDLPVLYFEVLRVVCLVGEGRGRRRRSQKPTAKLILPLHPLRDKCLFARNKACQFLTTYK